MLSLVVNKNIVNMFNRGLNKGLNRGLIQRLNSTNIKKYKKIYKPTHWYDNHSIIHTIFKPNTILHKCYIPKKFFDRTNMICDSNSIKLDYVKIKDNGFIDIIEYTYHDNKEQYNKKIQTLLSIKILLTLNGLHVNKLYILDLDTKNMNPINKLF